MKAALLMLAICLSLAAMSCSNDDSKPAAPAATTQPEAKAPAAAPEKTPVPAPAAPEAAAPAAPEAAAPAAPAAPEAAAPAAPEAGEQPK